MVVVMMAVVVVVVAVLAMVLEGWQAEITYTVVKWRTVR